MAPVAVSKSDRIVRRTVMVGAVTAAYFLLTADYGPNYPNPIRKAMESSTGLFSLHKTSKERKKQGGGNPSDADGHGDGGSKNL